MFATKNELGILKRIFTVPLLYSKYSDCCLLLLVSEKASLFDEQNALICAKSVCNERNRFLNFAPLFYILKDIVIIWNFTLRNVKVISLY